MAQATESISSAPASLPPAKRRWGARIASFTTRSLIGLAGLGLLIGFFLPWMNWGDAVTLSGFTLVVSSGVAVDAIAGPSHGLLFIVPIAAVGMIASAIFAPRAAAWVALLGGGSIILYGIYALMRFFLGSTGPGMWITVIASLVALAVGLIGFGRNTRSV
ncbi:MAG TPA: hypothetical protein VJR89_11065 [Polyangiales bacterium]|nr:hypothetical protein [Polyangiales bacterium]